MYSTMQGERTRSLAGPLNAMYKIFFKFAPSLAGGMDTDERGGRRATRGGRSQQFISLRRGLAMNAVDLVDLPLVGRLLLCVNGGISVDEGEAAQWQKQRARLPVVRVVFDELMVYRNETLASWRTSIVESRKEGTGAGGVGPPLIRLPLPRPTGTLTTTYIDDQVRVSRGEKGGIFVAARLRAPENGSGSK